MKHCFEPLHNSAKDATHRSETGCLQNLDFPNVMRPIPHRAPFQRHQEHTSGPTLRPYIPASHLHLHLHIRAAPALARPVPQQVAPLEVRVRMDDDIQLRRGPAAVLLDALQLGAMRPLEDAVARDVEALLVHVLADAAQHVAVGDARRLQQGGQVVGAEMAVRAPVTLAAAGRVLGQDLLAREGRVPAAAAAQGVAADVAVRVPHVVAVLLGEGVVGDEAEGPPPEEQAVLEREAESLEEERVLQPAEVLQVAVGPEGGVQVAHAEREVRRQAVDGGGGDGRAGEGGVRVR